MTATPSARAWELLRAALDLPPSQREAFVRKSCGDDAALRAEAMTLLSADGDVDSVLDTPLDPERILATTVDAAIGNTIGGYRLLDQIGRGGMGTVYRAERVGGVTHHHVALKVIKRGMDSDEVVRRFVREREILAQLKHPNIARLIDGGVSERGQIWFAMEMVDGAPITTWCDAHRLPIDRRIELFLAVCSAVQYAHRNLIVHRDLKPSNILVGGEGETKLLDFGIAKVLEEGGSGEAFTRSQMKMLTPDFAAPEQHRGEAVTTATDIYQLGLVLYELLCGRRALREGNRSTAIPRLAAASTLSSPGDIDSETVAAARAQSPNALRKSLQGDLDRIVHKALNEEPARRYESVSDFAQDLRRYLAGEPVQAVGDSLRYRAGKFVRRHRLGVAATVLIALAIAGGVAGTLWQAHQARLAAAKALAAAARAEQIKDFIGSVFSAADPYTSKRGSTTARDLLDTARARVDKELADQPEVAIELLNIIGKSYIEVEAIDPARDAFARALELAEKQFPAPHHWRAASRFQLSRALESSMQIEEAMRALDATIAELRALGEPEVAALIDALQVRSSMFHDHRQRDRALSDAREAMTLAEPRFGSGAPEYFVPLHAAAKLEEGPAKSFAMIERAYTLARDHYGAEKNPLLLDIADDYGHALGEAGRSDDAIRVLGDAVKTRRELFGEHNFRVAGDLNALGVEQLRGGHYQAALDALREAEEIFKQYSEAGPHMAMVSLGDVVQAELLSGDDVGAQRDAQAVISGLSMMGAKSRTWLMAQVALGATQLRTHHASAAIATLRDALSGWAALAPTHRGAGLAHVWLAMALSADKQVDDAHTELALARTNLSASTFRGDQQLLAEAVAAIETPARH